MSTIELKDILQSEEFKQVKEYADKIRNLSHHMDEFLYIIKESPNLKETPEEKTSVIKKEDFVSRETERKISEKQERIMIIKHNSFQSVLEKYKADLNKGGHEKTTADLIKSADEITKWITSDNTK